MNNMSNIFQSKTERRCATCGCRASGAECAECGSALPPRSEIGVLAGVNTNYGTVNNVYNIGQVPQEPEIVDLRDIQDGLNQRFPERVLPPQPPPPKALGPAKALSPFFVVLGAVLAVVFVAVMAAFLWM